MDRKKIIIAAAAAATSLLTLTAGGLRPGRCADSRDRHGAEHGVSFRRNKAFGYFHRGGSAVNGGILRRPCRTSLGIRCLFGNR